MKTTGEPALAKSIWSLIAVSYTPDTDDSVLAIFEDKSLADEALVTVKKLTNECQEKSSSPVRYRLVESDINLEIPNFRFVYLVRSSISRNKDNEIIRVAESVEFDVFSDEMLETSIYPSYQLLLEEPSKSFHYWGKESADIVDLRDDSLGWEAFITFDPTMKNIKYLDLSKM